MFGDVLRELRHSRNMTLRQVGEKAGMDYITLNKIERGTRMPPSLEGLIAVADSLGLNEHEFERLLNASVDAGDKANPRFTPAQLEQLKTSGTAQAFFTRREKEKEGD